MSMDLLERMIETFLSICPDISKLSGWYTRGAVERRLYCEGITLRAGASKYVLISRELDYVVKFPIFDIDNWEDRYPILSESGNYDLSNFCAIEAAMYKEAKFFGLQKVFAESFFLDKIDGIKFYLQDKVDKPTADSIDTSYKFYNMAREVQEQYRFYYRPPECFCAIVAQHYGTDFLANLLTFINLYDINDLHGSNLGKKNDKPIMFDYSGYH